jgi:hypothetical protein
MNDKAKVLIPKQQLEIAKTYDVKPYGRDGKSLVSVNAINLSLAEGDPLVGKYQKYVTFNPDLQNYIKQLEIGARFLADIEERERPGTEYGPDRTIVQIYQDGKPVSQVKKSGGYGKSPEVIKLEHDNALAMEAVKRRSIEGQKAMEQIGQILITPTSVSPEILGLEEDDLKRIVEKYWKAVEKALDNYLATDKPAVFEHAPTQDKSSQGKQGTATKKEAVSNGPIKHVGDLLTRANKIGLNPAHVAEITGIPNVHDMRFDELDQHWAKILDYNRKVIEQKI